MLHKPITDVSFSTKFPRCGNFSGGKEESKFISFFNKSDEPTKCKILQKAHDLFVFALNYYKAGIFDLEDKSENAFKIHYIDKSNSVADFSHNIQYLCFYNAIIVFYRENMKLSLDEIITAVPEFAGSKKAETAKMKLFLQKK